MDQLLATKLHIPTLRPDLVPRTGLIKRLNDGIHRKMTLISAPAGFGKTTLVREWVGHLALDKDEGGSAYRVAWLSLDESDNDPAHFLAYLIASLNHSEVLEDDLGERLLSMLRSPQPPPVETILTSLINEISGAQERIILCIDDYHLIESQPIHGGLAFLLENLPLFVHLVLATREDPHLPLARLRARGQVTELRAADLKFSPAEAAQFLKRVTSLELSREDIDALETRTEGWIAGLQLAAISMQGHNDAGEFIKSFAGSHRFVMDYLIEEVLAQQPEQVLTFLLQTSILNRLTGSLCDAVTGEANSQATLELLDHNNLFIIPLDDDRRWYRYHHLFTDLLRRRLHQSQSEKMPLLHQRASQWYQHNGFADEAISHALHAQDFEHAARLIDRAAEAAWKRGEDTKLRRWLDGLPVELQFSKPTLCIFQAWLLLASGELDAADRFLEAADMARPARPDRTTDTAGYDEEPSGQITELALQGRIATTRAFSAFYRGDIPAIIRHARQALEDLPEQDLDWRSTATHVLGDAYDFMGEMDQAYDSRLEAVAASTATGNSFQIMIANLKLAIIQRNQGRLGQVKKICESQMQLAEESGMAQTIVAGWLLAIWGEVLAEGNELEAAIRHAEKGVELTERGGDLAMLGWSYICLIRVLFSRGDLSKAEEIVNRLENTAREKFIPPWIMNLGAAWKARIWLSQGKLEAAEDWASHRGLDASGDLLYFRELEYIALARIHISQEKTGQAVELLNRLLSAAESGGRTSRLIEILILQAAALQAQGDRAPASDALERALGLAEPGGFVRIFLDEGSLVARLLYASLSSRPGSDYVRRLLAAFSTSQQEPIEQSKPDAPHPEFVESLSDRELEVLQLIAEGLTNQDIATRLFLSLNTVKVHTRNIYGKLGVKNRTQAVSKARALGILAST